MHPPPFRLFAAAGSLLILLAALPLSSRAQVPDTSSPPPVEVPVRTPSASTDKDAPYVPTAQSVVDKMLEVANVSSDDVVYDLGSGDGRIPVTAAEKHGARGVGIEIDSGLVAKARANARAAGLADKVEFRQEDLFEVDLSEATVVALYLWTEMNIKLRPTLLRQLDPGDRIVAHDFRMGEWEPDRTVDAGQGNTGRERIFLWIVPENVPDDLIDISDEPEIN